MSYDKNIVSHAIALEVSKKFATGDDAESYTNDMVKIYDIAFNTTFQQLNQMQPSTKATMKTVQRYY